MELSESEADAAIRQFTKNYTNMNKAQKDAHAHYANAEEAFERVIDSLLQLPTSTPVDPKCLWG